MSGPSPAKLQLGLPRAVIALVIGVGLGSTLERCTSTPEPQKKAAQAEIEPSLALVAHTAAPQSKGAAEPVEVSPVIRSVCHALHTLPRERRAECAGHKPGATVAAACEKTLAAAVQRGGLELDSAAAERCVAAMSARYADCGFAQARALRPEAACQAFLRGTVADGGSCGSSLECGTGSHCHGAGPFDRGVCGPPRPTGARCELGADPLASYIAAPEERHPECRGRCVQGRCAEASGS